MKTIRGTMLFVAWVAMLAYYGWLKTVLLVVLIVGLFFGSMFLFAL